MTKVVILAAGKGLRMQSELPKVLVTLFDKPMIRFVIEAAQKTNLGKPMVVIGHQADIVREVLGEEVDYVHQGEILGTGHALAAGRDFLKEKHENVMVIYGDIPFVNPDTIMRLNDMHCTSGATLTMATTSVPDFNDWRYCLHDYGRIVRNLGGDIAHIIQPRDATPSVLAVNEVTVNMYCFNAAWLWDNILKLTNNNAKGEFFLTDLVKFAFAQKQKISTLAVNAMEAVRVSTPEGLKLAEGLLQRRLVK